MNVDYLLRKKDIDAITVADVKIDQSEIDIITMRHGDINKIKRERIPQEKKKRLEELNKEYGIEKGKEDDAEYNAPAMKDIKDPRMRIYDLLMGKGLVKKDGK